MSDTARFGPDLTEIGGSSSSANSRLTPSAFFLARGRVCEAGPSVRTFLAEDAERLLGRSEMSRLLRAAVATALKDDASNPELFDRILTDTKSELIFRLVERGVSYDHRDESSFCGWFFCRAHDTARSLFRPELGQKILEREHRSLLTTDLPAPPDRSQYVEDRETVLDMVKNLPEAEREAVTRVLESTERIEDTARRLGRSPGYVSSALHRAIVKLRRKLEACESGDGSL
jgi:RNA polymerase sigma factor (sigma-70 family)